MHGIFKDFMSLQKIDVQASELNKLGLSLESQLAKIGPSLISNDKFLLEKLKPLKEFEERFKKNIVGVKVKQIKHFFEVK